MSHWVRFPYEVKETIVVHTVNNPNTLCAPSAFRDILLLSCETHDTLVGAPARGSPANNALLVRLYKTRFDLAAPIRWLLARGDIHTADVIAGVFKERCLLIRDIKSGEWSRRLQNDLCTVGEFEQALWTIYLMLLEDDGKNRAQLENAGVEDFLRTLVVTFADQKDEDGWPKETRVLQLSAASLAIVSDRASVLNESIGVRIDISNSLRPFLLAGHRYPVAHIPITQLELWPVDGQSSVLVNSLRTLDNMPVYPPQSFPYFGRIVTLAAPPIFSSAVILITNRNEVTDSWFSPNLPLDRASADALGIAGATQYDWKTSNFFRRQAIGVEIPRVGSDRENLACLENPPRGSKRWEFTFHRMRIVSESMMNPGAGPRLWYGYGALYQPGMFAGNWRGRLIIPDFRMSTRILAMHPAPLEVVERTLADEELGVYYNNFQITLREHISTDFEVGYGDEELGFGVQNGYFPSHIDPSVGRGMYETGTELVVSDPTDEPAWAIKRYKTWHEGMVLQSTGPAPAFPLETPRASDVEVPEDVERAFLYAGVGMEQDDDEAPHVVDVIITGETDYESGRAWGAYTIYGRMRVLDGLVVLVRTPQDLNPDSGLGRWIFYGYMQQANTIVGRWRETGTDMRTSGFQGPFIMSKVGPTWGLPAESSTGVGSE